MTRGEAIIIIEQWCRGNTTLSTHDCRVLARSLADRVLETCEASSRHERFDGSLRVDLVPPDAATMLRRCLQHHDGGHVRRLPDSEIKHTAGVLWRWITEDVFGITYSFREPAGSHAAPRG